MIRISVDDCLGAKLREAGEQAELCDPAGKTLGLFVPANTEIPIVRPTDECPYSPEELAQLHQETQGRPLAEILKDLQAT